MKVEFGGKTTVMINGKDVTEFVDVTSIEMLPPKTVSEMAAERGLQDNTKSLKFTVDKAAANIRHALGIHWWLIVETWDLDAGTARLDGVMCGICRERRS
jgi:hypothetical protein